VGGGVGLGGSGGGVEGQMGMVCNAQKMAISETIIVYLPA
jgi:hypothetical protein